MRGCRSTPLTRFLPSACRLFGMKTDPLQRRLLVLAVVLASALFASACGSTSAEDLAIDETTPNDRAGDEAAPPNDNGSEDSDSGGSDSTVSSDGETKTLDDYLGTAAPLLRGNARRSVDDDLLEERRLIQQEIQVCMQAEGFTYVPEAVGAGIRFVLATNQSGESSQDYAETEGFGLSTRFDALFEGDIDLTEDSDPNAEHLATLSDGEADAWQFALRGAPPERNEQGQLIDPDTGEVIQGGPGRVRGGCTRDAQTIVRGDLSALNDLADDFAELEERIAADPRVAAINRDWIGCMLEAGFDYQDEEEARTDIRTQIRPLLRSFFTSGDATAAQGGQGGQGQGGQGQGRNPLQALAGLQLTDDQEAELDALQDLERATATASFVCKGDTDAEVAEITARYEAEFVDANRSTLESLDG